MAKALGSLLFAAAMLIGSSFTMAAVQTYDSKVAQFTVDVPEGWKSKAISDGCQIDSADGKNTMSVQFFPPSDKSPLSIAKHMSGAMKMKVTNEKTDGESALVEGTAEGDHVSVLVVKGKYLINCAIFGGPDRDAMVKIYSSVKDKR